MKDGICFVEVNDEPLHQEIFINDHVRIYRAILKPGNSTEFHRHSKNTLYVAVCGGDIATVRMKGYPACPTILSKRVSLAKRIFLLFQKTFFKYLSISNGLVFYMPSKNNPVIHRAIASSKNIYNMSLIGIEVLFSNNMKEKGKDVLDTTAKTKFCSGIIDSKIEIETEEIITSRICIKPNQKIYGKNLYRKGFFFILSGRLDIVEKDKNTYLFAGDYYFNDNKIIESIENKGKKQMEILYTVFKQ